MAAILSALLIAGSSFDVTASTRAFHTARRAQLEAPEGWLSVVGLLWLKEGENRVGADSGNDLICPAGWPASLGIFTRARDQVEITPRVPLTVEGKPFTGGPIAVGDEGESARFASGPLRFNVIRRGDRVGLRLRDTGAPARAGLTEIPAYLPSAAWRVTARFEAADAGAVLPIQNVLGQMRDEPTPGSAVFTVGGQTYRLAATQDDDGSLFFVFGDATNGDTTYGAGRFLSASPPQQGVVILDFNQATNPPCAFTPFATCPVPPRGNRLSLRVEAGERRPPGHE
jgi:uncharacterized protein